MSKYSISLVRPITGVVLHAATEENTQAMTNKN